MVFPVDHHLADNVVDAIGDESATIVHVNKHDIDVGRTCAKVIKAGAGLEAASQDIKR